MSKNSKVDYKLWRILAVFFVIVICQIIQTLISDCNKMAGFDFQACNALIKMFISIKRDYLNIIPIFYAASVRLEAFLLQRKCDFPSILSHTGAIMTSSARHFSLLPPKLSLENEPYIYFAIIGERLLNMMAWRCQ